MLGKQFFWRIVPRVETLTAWEAAGISATIVALIVLSLFAGLTWDPNADGLYCLSLVDDLLHGSTPFRWMMGGPSFFVPDMLIVFVGRILGFDEQGNFAFYTVVIVLLLFISLVALLRACGLRRTPAFVGALISTVAFYFSGNFGSAAVAFPAVHTGMLPLICFSFAAVATLLDRAWSSGTTFVGFKFHAIICLLATMAVMSDFIAIAQLIAPALLSLWVVVWRYRQPRGILQSLLMAGLHGLSLEIGTALGFVVWQLLRSTEFFSQPTLGFLLHFHDAPQSLATFLSVSTFDGAEGFFGLDRLILVIAGLLVACAFGIVAFTVPQPKFRRVGLGKPGPFFCILAIASCAVSSLVAPIASGIWVGAPSFRYQWPSLLFATVLLVLLLFFGLDRLARSRKMADRSIVAAGVAISLLLLIPFGKIVRADVQRGFPPPYLPTMHGVAAALRQNDLNFVLAGYWVTKPLIQVTQRQMYVCPTSSDLTPYLWIMNIEWCSDLYRTWSKKRARLAILMDAKVARFPDGYGIPARVLKFEGATFQGYVFDWNKDLDNRLKTAVCRPFIGARLPKPAFCS